VGGSIAENMRWKYAALQPVVEQKARDGDAYGQYTYRQHRNIFTVVMKPLLFEGCVLSILIMLFALGYEHVSRTEDNIYSSKTGRDIIRRKLAAGLAAGLGAYAVLAAISLVPLYTAYTDIWNENVSGAFNYFYDLIAGPRPFATWRSFTVWGYLWAAIGVSAGIVVCCSVAAFAAGVTIRNSYAGFLAIFLVVIACVFIPMIAPNNNYLTFVFIYTPVWLFIKLPFWFTDGGMDVLWRDFETWGTCVSLALLSSGAVLAAYRMKRRDIL
jgi:hypothetical protein